MNQDRTLAICVATYRRPTLLARLLDGIAQLAQPDGIRVELRIIENDADASCQAMITRWRNDNPQVPTRYAVQPQRNIARTRNAALAMGYADFYAFVDDDESPEPDWLVNLVETLERGGFDAVFGDVLADLPDNAPRWIRRGQFLNKRVHEQLGERRWQATRTANALVRGEWLRERRFAPDFGTSGGEDSRLFRDMADHGARFGWAPQAKVHEAVQPEQCTLRWLFRRYRRSGLVYEQLVGRPWPLLRAMRRMVVAGGSIVAGIPGVLTGSNTLAYGGCLRFATALGSLDHIAGASHRSFRGYESAGCES